MFLVIIVLHCPVILYMTSFKVVHVSNVAYGPLGIAEEKKIPYIMSLNAFIFESKYIYFIIIW